MPEEQPPIDDGMEETLRRIMRSNREGRDAATRRDSGLIDTLLNGTPDDWHQYVADTFPSESDRTDTGRSEIEGADEEVLEGNGQT